MKWLSRAPCSLFFKRRVADEISSRFFDAVYRFRPYGRQKNPHISLSVVSDDSFCKIQHLLDARQAEFEHRPVGEDVEYSAVTFAAVKPDRRVHILRSQQSYLAFRRERCFAAGGGVFLHGVRTLCTISSAGEVFCPRKPLSPPIGYFTKKQNLL